MVCLGLVLVTVTLALGGPAPEPPKVPKELLEKRRDAARKVFDNELQRFQMGALKPEVSVIELAEWSSRWLEAELAIGDKRTDQIAACKAHLKRMRDLEEAAVGKVGPATKPGQRLRLRSEADAVTYFRVEAEIRLIKAGGTPRETENRKEPGRAK
jgi:hypothetical protein